MIKNSLKLIKQHTPRPILKGLSLLRNATYRTIDNCTPYLKHISYQGYRVFYTSSPQGTTIDRIRLGNVERIYEKELCQQIISELNKKDNSILVDVGSNLGLVSLYVLKNTRSADLKIFAFEPGPHQHTLFQTTLLANHLEHRITLSNMAISNESDAHHDFFTSEIGDSSADGFIDTERCTNMHKIKVPTTTLDNWWHKNDKPNISVIKVDTEGAELWVLEGAHGILHKCKPVIFMEIALINLKAYPYSAMNILKYLTDNQYALFTEDNRLCTKENLPAMLKETYSYIARPA